MDTKDTMDTKDIHGVGIYIKDCFLSDDYFNRIQKEHNFQNLKQSNKPDTAFRKGIYLTPVSLNNERVDFHVLRCSTNLDGPTDNFRPTDHYIVSRVNTIAKQYFKDAAVLNHVLAQIYVNSKTDTKQHKARIARHSDKTKDMPSNGLIAFCTFYSPLDSTQTKYSHSALTSLRFRLKSPDTKRHLKEDFTVELHPNSLLLIPLSTNRLYTHEIVPSILSVDQIPTRMGYVIRSSNTPAYYYNDTVYVNDIPLKSPTSNEFEELKNLYKLENTTDDVIEYPNIEFSMNSGDYLKPLV